jgi:hypothetical protein
MFCVFFCCVLVLDCCFLCLISCPLRCDSCCLRVETLVGSAAIFVYIQYLCLFQRLIHKHTPRYIVLQHRARVGSALMGSLLTARSTSDESLHAFHFRDDLVEEQRVEEFGALADDRHAGPRL